MYQQTAPGKTNNWAMFEVRQTQLTAPLRNFLTLVLYESLFEVVGREKEPRLLPHSGMRGRRASSTDAKAGVMASIRFAGRAIRRARTAQGLAPWFQRRCSLLLPNLVD